MDVKKQLVSVKPDGTVESKEVEAYPTLDELKAIVGGYIEIVPYFQKCDGAPCVAFCNEYGKLHGLPLNKHATLLWRLCQTVIRDDYLVGTIAIVIGPADWVMGPKDEEDGE